MEKRDVIFGLAFLLLLFYGIFDFISDKKRDAAQELMKATTGIKISELPSASSFNNTDQFPVAQGGVTRKITGTQINGAVSDSVGQLRYEVDTAKANIRAAGVGGGTGSDTLLYAGDISDYDSVSYVQAKQFTDGSGFEVSLGTGFAPVSFGSHYTDIRMQSFTGGGDNISMWVNDLANLYIAETLAQMRINNAVNQQWYGDSVVFPVKAKFKTDIYWDRNSGLSGNYNVIWNATSHKFDTATFVPGARQAWIDGVGFWPLRYLTAKKHKALPLPNRKGENLWYIEPSEGTYQIEYELEMLNQGLAQLWILVVVFFGAFVLIGWFFPLKK